MQPRRGLADELEQTRLDVHVQVFEVLTPVEAAALYLAPDGLEPADDSVGVRLRHDALPREHPRVRYRAVEVVVVETAVIAYGDGVAR